AGVAAGDGFGGGQAGAGNGGGRARLRRLPRPVALLRGERRGQGDEPRREQGDERARRHAGQRKVPAAGGVSPPPSQCANQVRMRSSRSTSSHGGPVRDKPWYERGYRTNSAGIPRLRSMTNSCSPSVTGVRRSSSECTMSSGVRMRVAYVIGESTRYSESASHGGPENS